ncbi:hypothetical protein CC1G_00030 [Coprinopsis cinerea okayama7|uniref:Uncharacterized protein n=1 Tax=Coprinopsis cinerea (strain Okayama-7 / 130 / ATCC MYA-4618 / FGSC 9003) TaxID=240176 RepID=A8NWH7_COPC7|nr:hypothetical protein CC1G_00030 [Coprinopsis cinerea okayama7\|eukprot:XP_001836894.2 hypothetical protein CC1G_00030 [Coprinopsis cinerea okayama7\
MSDLAALCRSECNVFASPNGAVSEIPVHRDDDEYTLVGDPSDEESIEHLLLGLAKTVLDSPDSTSSSISSASSSSSDDSFVTAPEYPECLDSDSDETHPAALAGECPPPELWLPNPEDSNLPPLYTLSGECLDFILFMIVKLAFPRRSSTKDGHKWLEIGRRIAFNTLAEMHYGPSLLLVPSFTALYYILVVFELHDLDDAPLMQDANIAGEVIVRIFSVFYVIASKWEEDIEETGPMHITISTFAFTRSSEFNIGWWFQHLHRMERRVLPILDYNIAVMPHHWPPFVSFLEFVFEQPELRKMTEHCNPALPILKGAYGCVGLPIKTLNRSDMETEAELELMKEEQDLLYEEIVTGRMMMEEHVPAFLETLCDGLLCPPSVSLEVWCGDQTREDRDVHEKGKVLERREDDDEGDEWSSSDDEDLGMDDEDKENIPPVGPQDSV